MKQKNLFRKRLVEKYNGKIFYTNDKTYSSSNIINNKNLINFNSKQEDFIRKINKKYNYQYLEKKLQILKK